MIVQDEIEKHRAWAYGYQPSKTDRSNFDYYTDVAAKPVGEPRGIFGHYTEQEIAEAEAKIAAGWQGFAARVRQSHIDHSEERVGKGGFDPYVATWAGRLDLAEKAARSNQAARRNQYIGAHYPGQTQTGRDRAGRDQTEGVDEGRLVHVSDDPRPEAGFFWAPLTTSPLAHRNGTQRVPFAYPAPRSTHTPCSGALPDLSFSL